ncbi:hypothetical protein B0I33_102519 [Prauserella shujinwangii]|uniref:Uncharacterized protein n=1 Tax=Prauserella shujinwangii TaxID=1453103 RepID=A0A2T0M1D3_9PSEU|nr:hypothetical protein [Prauserella shujinwangii]PRX50398.1 hypothetical protein B0I33_102519 [Prauserella shujinwangii]
MRNDAERTDERFVDLLCADDEWVRAEFDAIVTANFAWGAAHEHVPLPGAGTATVRAPRSGRAGPGPRATGGVRTAAAGDHWPRQRSPPPPAPRTLRHPR